MSATAPETAPGGAGGPGPSSATSSARAARRARVALLGPYSSRNLGDTAIQRAMVEQLRLRRPGLEIVGISPEPEDTCRSLGIPAFALTREGRPANALLAAVREGPARAALVRGLDLLIVSGGGQLDDFWGGAWGHPWSLLQWSAIARLQGVPVAVVGVGMDRLSTPLARRFAVAAMRLAAYRAFRDEDTRAELARLGLDRDSRLCPDPAFAITMPGVGEGAGGRRHVVLNPLSGKTWTDRPGEGDSAYLLAMAEAACRLAARGLDIRIACSQPTMDLPEALRLQALLRERGVAGVAVCPVARVEDYLAQVAGAELVIAARLHGALLALRAGSPVVALAPLPKVERLMRDVGLPRLCLPLQGLAAGALVARCEEVLARAGPLRAHIARVNEDFRARLARTFDEVVQLLP